MINLRILGRVRGLFEFQAGENIEHEQWHMNQLGDQLIAQSLPSLTELVRMGDSWQTAFGAGTAVTGIPTTTGKWSIWNGEPYDGKIYAIDSVALTKVLVDSTTTGPFTVFAQIIKLLAPPTSNGVQISSLCGKANYSGKCRPTNSSTTLSNYWDQIGQYDGKAYAIAGSVWESMDIPLFGRYILPPKAQFTISVGEITATTSKFRSVIRWHEVQLPRL